MVMKATTANLNMTWFISVPTVPQHPYVLFLVVYPRTLEARVTGENLDCFCHVYC